MSGIAHTQPCTSPTFKTTGQDRARKRNPLDSLRAQLPSMIEWHRGAANIRELDLTGMTGREMVDIPAGFLTGMGFTKLDRLILSENDFTELPAGIRELKVRELVVDHCPNLANLDGIKEMGVQVLEAEHCGFTAWPKALSDSHVTHVNLIGNKISAVPAYPASLQEVHLSGVKETFGAWCAAEGRYAPFTQVAGLPAADNALSDKFDECPYTREDGAMVICYTRVAKDMDVDTSEGELSDPGFYTGSNGTSPDYQLPSTPDRLPPEASVETPQAFKDALDRLAAEDAVDYFAELMDLDSRA